MKVSYFTILNLYECLIQINEKLNQQVSNSREKSSHSLLQSFNKPTNLFTGCSSQIPFIKAHKNFNCDCFYPRKKSSLRNKERDKRNYIARLLDMHVLIASHISKTCIQTAFKRIKHETLFFFCLRVVETRFNFTPPQHLLLEC